MPATNGAPPRPTPDPPSGRRRRSSTSRSDPRWVVTTIRLAGVAVFLSQAIAFPLLALPVSATALLIAAGAMGVAEAAKLDLRRGRREP